MNEDGVGFLPLCWTDDEDRPVSLTDARNKYDGEMEFNSERFISRVLVNHNSPPIVPVEINGTIIQALVDTGARETYIDATTASNLEKKLIKVPGSDPNGEKIIRVYTIDKETSAVEYSGIFNWVSDIGGSYEPDKFVHTFFL